MNNSTWDVFGASVQGASHIRAGRPNQDCVLWSVSDNASKANVLAVADGHGSAKSFRSDRGSRFAVQAAVQKLSSFLEDCEAPPNLSAIKRIAIEALPQKLVRQWVAAVDADLSSEGFTEAELGALEDNESGRARKAIAENRLVPYGSTILIAALTGSFAIYYQLGDGDIICVSDEGESTRPMEHDERLFGNETTSLCAPEAWKDFRISFQVFSEKLPAMVLLASDGYSNSYQNESGFLKVGGDILAAIRSDGSDSVKSSLPDWLSQTSTRGSGDDITVGLMVRRDISCQPTAREAGEVV